MDDLKMIIAKNLIELRTSAKLTQLELGEKLNYTDKAVSKWERGESMPDITVLKQIADLFGVTVDYLLQEEHSKKEVKDAKFTAKAKNHWFITIMSIILAWLVSTIIFVALSVMPSLDNSPLWLLFIYPVPISMIILLIFNSIWFKGKNNCVIISILMWTILASAHISASAFGLSKLWLLYVIGVPGQLIIIFWSRLNYKKVN